MKILKDIFLYDGLAWIKKERTLAIGDLHLGYEEYLNERGISIPTNIFLQKEKELKKLILKLKPQRIIFLGDLKHEFGTILKQEWEEIIHLICMIPKSIEIIIIKGNHDKILEPIIKKINRPGLFFLNSYTLKKEKMFFIHGDKIPLNKEFCNSKIIIIGHEHPAIELKEGTKKERYKCFLFGTWNKKKLIVLPSFFTIIGTDVLKKKFISPFLIKNKKINEFNIYVVGDKIYNFGQFKDIKKL